MDIGSKLPLLPRRRAVQSAFGASERPARECVLLSRSVKDSSPFEPDAFFAKRSRRHRSIREQKRELNPSRRCWTGRHFRQGTERLPRRAGAVRERGRCFVTRRRRPCRGHRSRRRCRARPQKLQAWVWARLAARLRPRQPSEPLWTPSLWQDGANGRAA